MKKGDKKAYSVRAFDSILREICSKTGVKKDDARTAVESYISIVVNSLFEGKPITVKGLGTFSTMTRRGGTFRCPYDGTSVEKEDALRVRFRASAGLKRLING